METTVYDNRAKELIAEIRQLIEIKGLNVVDALKDAGFSEEQTNEIFNGYKLPSLTEFLALCQVSGIVIQLPSVETPNNPM